MRERVLLGGIIKGIFRMMGKVVFRIIGLGSYRLR